MILSFHPCFVGAKNIICAGRNPSADEISAMRNADAIILPQGASQSLYQAATENCKHVFPDYRARFAFPGKIGQISLFRAAGIEHPKTEVFLSTHEFWEKFDHIEKSFGGFPVVFKFDWGGEGDTVFLAQTSDDIVRLLQKAESFEKTGQKGFLIQSFVPSMGRTLRVVVIYKKTISYWRVQENADTFHSNLSKGAVHDSISNPELQAQGIAAARRLCEKSGINLAGFDILFSKNNAGQKPLLLEINYYFGRRGLGGSEAYYALLVEQIHEWLNDNRTGKQHKHCG